LNSLAMVSKVSSTLGLSSASMAASDIEFSQIVLVEVGLAHGGFEIFPRRRPRH
jgi:hypothetical protein